MCGFCGRERGKVDSVCFDDRFNIAVAGLIVINVFINLHVHGELFKGWRFIGVRVDEMR